MIISIIAAMSSNRVIGRQGALPWDIREDMRRFRELTSGHTLIMGRKTFESIGRPLPQRKTIVISGQPDYSAPGCLTASSLDEAIRLAKPAAEVFICGGSEIYRQALPFAARIYLTVINACIDGDTTFPDIPENEFDMISSDRVSLVPDALLNVFVRKACQPQQVTDEDH